MICRTTSLYDKNCTIVSYDFYRSSDISFTVGLESGFGLGLAGAVTLSEDIRTFTIGCITS